MPRIDRLILREIVGPWIFGVAIFTVLIFASTVLFRFTNYLAKGVEFITVLKLTLLTLPAIMAKTFAMAMLLAALLGFGKLSSDSEIVALRAAGASLGRIMMPVAVFGFFVACLTFWFNEQVVPASTRQAEALNAELAQAAASTVLTGTAIAVEEQGRFVLIAATEFHARSATLMNAQITTFDKTLDPVATLYAKELEYRGPKDWRIRGRGRLVSVDGRTVMETEEDIWPASMPTLSLTPEDIIAAALKNMDTFSMKETRERIEALKRAPKPNERQIAALEYGYYNKIGLPLAAIIFGLIGAPLSIRNARTGAASGFWLSIIITFAYMMLANFMSVWAQGGVFPPYIASFTPLAIGLAFAVVTISRKN